MKQTKILTHATHVNGWFPDVYMSCMSQNFRLFHVSNLSVRNFRIFLLMYTVSLCRYPRPILGTHCDAPLAAAGAPQHCRRASCRADAAVVTDSCSSCNQVYAQLMGREPNLTRRCHLQCQRSRRRASSKTPCRAQSCKWTVRQTSL